jgi:hypothetical protein
MSGARVSGTAALALREPGAGSVVAPDTELLLDEHAEIRWQRTQTAVALSCSSSAAVHLFDAPA